MTTGFDRVLARREIILQDDEAADRAEWVVVSHRTAYWRPDLVDRLRRGGGRRVAVRSRLGVELSALWHFPPQDHKFDQPFGHDSSAGVLPSRGDAHP